MHKRAWNPKLGQSLGSGATWLEDSQTQGGHWMVLQGMC